MNHEYFTSSIKWNFFTSFLSLLQHLGYESCSKIAKQSGSLPGEMCELQTGHGSGTVPWHLKKSSYKLSHPATHTHTLLFSHLVKQLQCLVSILIQRRNASCQAQQQTETEKCLSATADLTASCFISTTVGGASLLLQIHKQKEERRNKTHIIKISLFFSFFSHTEWNSNIFLRFLVWQMGDWMKDTEGDKWSTGHRVSLRNAEFKPHLQPTKQCKNSELCATQYYSVNVN